MNQNYYEQVNQTTHPNNFNVPNYNNANNFPGYNNMNNPYINPYSFPYYNPYNMYIPFNCPFPQYGSMIPSSPPGGMQHNCTYCPDCLKQKNEVQKTETETETETERQTETKKRSKALEQANTSIRKKKRKGQYYTKKIVKPDTESPLEKFRQIIPKNKIKNTGKNEDKKSPFGNGTLVVTTNAQSGSNPPPFLSGILNVLLGGAGEDEDGETSFNPFNMLKKEAVEVKDIKEVEKEEEEDLSQYEFKHTGPIKNLNDLIALGKEYGKSDVKYRYNINMKKLSKMVEPLEEFQNLIGMEKIKKEIFNKIIFYLQELETNKDMLHMAIQGAPGVGKSRIIGILAKIYKTLGILSKGHIVTIKRDDLIGGYLGQTSIKTRQKLEKAKGGILLIDEAYALGNEELRDSYSKEAIDMLTPYLSEEANDFICIIAGYEKQLDKCFFAYNEGLERRFTRYTIDKYSDAELRQIFIKIVQDNEWNFVKDNADTVLERQNKYNDLKQKYDDLEAEFENTKKRDKYKITQKMKDYKKQMNEIATDNYLETIPMEFFKKNRKYFIFNGGDMLKLFGYCKNAHAGRLLKITDEEEIKSSKKFINNGDLEEALKLYLMDPKISERGEEATYTNMYV